MNNKNIEFSAFYGCINPLPPTPKKQANWLFWNQKGKNSLQCEQNLNLIELEGFDPIYKVGSLKKIIKNNCS